MEFVPFPRAQNTKMTSHRRKFMKQRPQFGTLQRPPRLTNAWEGGSSPPACCEPRRSPGTFPNDAGERCARVPGVPGVCGECCVRQLDDTERRRTRGPGSAPACRALGASAGERGEGFMRRGGARVRRGSGSCPVCSGETFWWMPHLGAAAEAYGAQEPHHLHH